MKTIFSTASIALILAAGSTAAQDIPQANDAWFTAGQEAMQAIIDREMNTGRAKNVILLVADGDGVGTNYATRLYAGQRQGKLGEEHVLPYETPDFHSALVKTYSINAQTPDSAPTPMNTGVKQRFNLINLGGDAIHDDCSTAFGNELTTFAEIVTGMGAQYAWNTETFNGLSLDGSAPVLALFNDSHMEYEADRAEDDEPSLAEMTKAAIEYLSSNENGYYLEIEAGRVDHANHAGNAKRTMIDGMAFADAVAMADELTDDADTLIIVTAEHEHSIAFNGYCGRGTPIEGLCYGVAQTGEMHSDELVLADDGKPHTVVGHLNGAGSVLTKVEGENDYSGSRPELTQEEATDIDYVQQALIPKSSESHSGEDVAVYAKGPWAHLFDGTIEQNVIFHVMNHAVAAE